MGLLDKFWSKKKTHLTNLKPDNQDLTIPEDWNSYMCQIDEQPASYFLNLALAKIAPLKNRPRLLWFEIQMNHSREDGLSSSEEFDHLIQIEDQIILALTTTLPILYVGRLTHNHLRDFYFYCEEGIDINNIINQVMRSYPNYNYRFGQKIDPDWKTYFDYMYPSQEILQTISNHSVIENLQKHGDLLEIARPVHHWIYFKNKHDRVIFIKMIEALGFEVVQQNKVKEREDFPYQLQISRIDHVHHQAIDACTLQIQELAQQSNAEYDGWETQVIRN
ncbi:DUF695 domain-containing protein [Acinetobacter pittii]|uniref:DUF695 domain-containing protein n=1 Tax=Acinetobacter pittii TaxID=48296 RepID=UPI000584E7CF|nr:DUF695 domain-containing protein [Acinetobacter pittii]KIE86650.1 hypothetical protein SD67_04305 [Acinetobacter pittii]MBN6523939.1 DUF695 domain-containing protein [Acinetobacter pittii]MCG5263696.1 DUF695 domain-containing protein [Acinetobacter pittii]